MSDFVIKQGSRLPGIRARLSAPGVDQASGVEFHMKQLVNSGVPATKTGTAVIDDATSPDVLVVHYDWGASDTDTIGLWNGEWWATIGGKLMKIPADGYLSIEVQDDAQ